MVELEALSHRIQRDYSAEKTPSHGWSTDTSHLYQSQCNYPPHSLSERLELMSKTKINTIVRFNGHNLSTARVSQICEEKML